jgi:peptide/nickel transport system substrate-binding protein
MTQLRTGAVNIVEDPPIQQLAQIKKDSTLKVSSTPVGVMRLGLNTAKPPLDDVHVRRAVSLTLDRQSMVQAVLGGDGSVACSWISATVLRGYKPDFGCKTDLAQAKSEMAMSKYANGASFTLIYDSADAQMPLTAQVVQSNLAQIGIQVKLDGTTNQLYKAALANQSFQGRFSLFALPGDPGLSMANYINTNAESTSSPVLPQIKQEFEQSAGIFDEAARFKLYNTMADQIAGDADAVGLYSPEKVFASSAKVSGLVVMPTNKVDFASISISK